MPTQLLAKLVSPEIDSHCLQFRRGGKGAFDARSLCQKVIVPFDKEHENVLGGSPEPYVSNPLRNPEISQHYQEGLKDKKGWNNLCFVLDYVEKANKPVLTKKVFQQVLIEIRRRLAKTQVTYPVPRRVSHRQTIEIVDRFLRGRSGGDRAQAVVSALLKTVGTELGMFSKVVRTGINVADASSGQVADIECYDKSDKLALAVEVKDRDLTLTQVKQKLTTMRARHVTDILFIAFKGNLKKDESDIDRLVAREFSSGQNIYVFGFHEFADSLIALLGEKGRSGFLGQVAADLDEFGSDIEHRREWARLLGEV